MEAPDVGIGVVRVKGKEKHEHTTLYLSRKFSESEKRFGITKGKYIAMIFAVKKLRYYLGRQRFKIEFDHHLLVSLKNNAGNNPKLLQGALSLQGYDCEFTHKPGKENSQADCLSRI